MQTKRVVSLMLAGLSAGAVLTGCGAGPAATPAVVRAAVEAGVDHIDTSDFYGPHVTNEIIREALSPYAAGLTIVTKVGALRGADGSWNRAESPAELRSAVHDNLRNLGVDALDVVNFRAMGEGMAKSEKSIAPQFEVLAEMQREGLIRQLGVSHVHGWQVEEAQKIAPVVCVQNEYNLATREDDGLIEDLAAQGIAYVPYFPLGGFTPLQSSELSDVAGELGATPMQVALAWLLQRAANVLLIPGTSSVGHLRENLAAAAMELPAAMLTRLDAIGA